MALEEIRGPKHTAVSTPGDLHFHIRATQPSVAYDMASAITAALRDIAEVLEEVHGFRYWDGRSIIGFVDGTENPQTPAAVTTTPRTGAAATSSCRSTSTT